jgi:hypothetical protein
MSKDKNTKKTLKLLFFNEVSDKISKKYPTKVYEHFIKFKKDGKIFDYYPGAESICTKDSKNNYVWKKNISTERLIKWLNL